MKTLCALRDLTMALETYERNFQSAHGLSLKEGMLLCCIAEQQITASDIACKIDMTNSNCSKVIKSVEQKGYVERSFGVKDKRHMLFLLTDAGKKSMEKIQQDEVSMPALLKKIIEI